MGRGPKPENAPQHIDLGVVAADGELVVSCDFSARIPAVPSNAEGRATGALQIDSAGAVLLVNGRGEVVAALDSGHPDTHRVVNCLLQQFTFMGTLERETSGFVVAVRPDRP